MRKALIAAGVILAGCGASKPGRPSMKLTSPVFSSGTAIPRAYTCDGRDVSPPLSWSGVPARARQLTLEMIDRDAPGGSFVHWQLAGISATTTHLGAAQVPAQAVQGRNSFGRIGYGGPCPPAGGKPHHYLFTIAAFAGRQLLAVGTLTGTYGRP